MKTHRILTLIVAVALIILVTAVRLQVQAQQTAPRIDKKEETKVANPEDLFLSEVPVGYRDWRLISVAHEEGTLRDIRAILGNDIAINAYRKGSIPFPDGTIIARLAWAHVPSDENNKSFGRFQSFVAGHPTNGVQFMVKDSKKYAATGGWGYGHFENGKPAERSHLETCFPCHKAVEYRDFVFTRYSP